MTKYGPLKEYLESLSGDAQHKTISFAKIEQIIEDQLPKSAHKYRAWWGNEREGSHTQARSWLDAGWVVDTVNLSNKWVRFKFTAENQEPSSPSLLDMGELNDDVDNERRSPSDRNQGRRQGEKIVLISCVKSKENRPMAASELYNSDWFKKASTHAKHIGDRWYILSAKYGLLPPDQVIKPYDKTLKTITASKRKKWSNRVLSELKEVVSPEDEVIIMAGLDYRQYLVEPLRKWGCKISIPMEGMDFFEQLHWLTQKMGKL